MYWDLLKVDLFLRHYSFVNSSWNVLSLGVFGLRGCVFVNKGGQHSVILFEENISFLGWIIY